MLYTTLALIRSFSKENYVDVNDRVGKKYGENDPISLDMILNLEPNGLEIAVQCLCHAVFDDSLGRDVRRVSWCLAADYLDYLPVSKWSKNGESQEAVSVMRRYAFGEATEQEVQTAWEDAHELLEPFGYLFDLNWAFFITSYIPDEQWRKDRFLLYLSRAASETTPLRKESQ